MYKELGTRFNIPAIEKEILEFWEKNRIFEKSIESRDAENPFVFYEGPPTANGRPGIHHVLARTVKDLVCRLKTMQGYRVERKAGWDTHGLPVEIEVEKELGITKKDDIETYGVEKFNQKCHESVWKYKSEWDELTRRMGYWINLDDPYITYDNKYIESVWWILSQLWEKGLVYEGHKIIPYCPRCETPLSGHEVAQGYKDIDDPSVFVRMQLIDDPKTSFLVWTTTPWTLISNVALALNPTLEYVLVEHEGEKLILAKSRLDCLTGEYKIRQTYKGSQLAGQRYKRLFEFLPTEKDAFFTVTADFVTADDGTGIVHIAPAFGEEDNQVGKKHNLPHLNPVMKDGKFDERIKPYAGQFFKEADPNIIKDMKASGILMKSESHTHSYPHCWRCSTPLIYYSYKSWYIATTKLKDRMQKLNATIDWHPKEVGEKRFGEWLRNNIDWSLSRERFWGTPLPIWKCDSCNHTECIGSIEQLKERAGVLEINDLHKPYVDNLNFPCTKCKGTMIREPEVIDVWFDSGSMPIAQWHYPFENKEIFKHNFPADFISEGVDQTRGWFYSLLAISTLLFDQTCYKSCISLEMILDKTGQKMSKSKGNTVNPFEVIEKFGADAARWYLMAVSPPWLPTRFDEEGVAEVVRKFFGTALNTYNFFAMYANIDNFGYDSGNLVAIESRPEIDRWIISRMNRLVKQVDDYLKKYDITKLVRSISDYLVDDVSNWYVRRNRRRFWKSEVGEDKLAAYQTLYEVLLTVAKLIAPVAPFLSEEIYRNLTADSNEAQESVHLETFPQPKAHKFRDEELENRMDLVRDVVLSGRSLRNDAGVKVRQPLSRLIVVTKTQEQQTQLDEMLGLIQEELNIKKITYANDASELMSKKAEPNFKKLGPKFGKNVNAVAQVIRDLPTAAINELESKGELHIDSNGVKGYIEKDDVRIVAEGADGLIATMEGTYPVALDTALTPELIAEGYAREFVNRIQNMRKDAGYEVVDRIIVGYSSTHPELENAFTSMQSYIQTETLSEQINAKVDGFEVAKEWKIDGKEITLAIKRI
ncbi:MAG: isoleucine--tRNA ligase [Deferribacteres bacterium]|nr:isoleucine--tRNA ligase [candidate division KSB1 bacterium]MCB9504039.1 isoleucine--tRNA ligase [Deferribacteres bacterium]